MQKRMLAKIPWKIIHMSSSTEREGLVKQMEEMFGATRLEAVSGISVQEKYQYLSHPVPGQTHTPGMYGCLESHLQALSTPESEYVGILEDDAMFVATKEELEGWLHQLPPDWDIACLGTTENVRFSTVNSFTHRITRFWGTHAMIFKRSCIPKIFATYERTMQKGVLPLADWLYAWAIQEHNLIAYAPSIPTRFCHQKEGLVSYLTGQVRKPPTGSIVPQEG